MLSISAFRCKNMISELAGTAHAGRILLTNVATP